MLTKKAVYSLIIMCTLGTHAALAQNSGTTADTKLTTNVDLNALKTADMVRKQQLLEQSTKLQNLYAAQLELISKTEISLADAKQKCYQTCTRPEIKDLVGNVARLSGTIGVSMTVANTLRVILGASEYPATNGTKSQWLTRGALSFRRPMQTVAGRIMLGSTVLFSGSLMLQSFVDTQDKFSREQIGQFENDLKNYKGELSETQRNLSITNAALAQSLRVEQVSTVREKTTIGY